MNRIHTMNVCQIRSKKNYNQHWRRYAKGRVEKDRSFLSSSWGIVSKATWCPVQSCWRIQVIRTSSVISTIIVMSILLFIANSDCCYFPFFVLILALFIKSKIAETLYPSFLCIRHLTSRSSRTRKYVTVTYLNQVFICVNVILSVQQRSGLQC